MRSVWMRNIVVGTAGHIDHGKTALVRALTGIDTDRLEEEKRRGISIDLGFAHLELPPDIRLGFVDVPGHERFIKNMLAGVGGIDLVLFIIAADESIKPQTREHFDICRLLRIPAGVIALTKMDLVDTDIAELVRLEVDEFVAGSFLEGAPIVGVSAVTGQGLPELKEALRHHALQAKAKDISRWFRMPVDRSFSMRGFGTVVTGTVISGSVAVEQEVEIHPPSRRARVRGAQVHGSAVQKAAAGQRTALNLASVEVADVGRGMVLSEPGRFEPTRYVDARLELLRDAHPLAHAAPVHFHAGTAEIEAQVRLLDPPSSLQPGASGYVRFVLRQPTMMLPGDRFIVRMFSPVVTIGGGEVLDIHPPLRIRRSTSAARLRQLDGAGMAARIALLVGESRYGLGEAALIARTGVLPAELLTIAKSSAFLAIAEPQFWLIDRKWTDAKLAALHETVRLFHKQNPLSPGMTKEDLRARVVPNSPEFLLNALLSQSKTVAIESETVRLASHKIAFREDEEQALRKIESAFESAGLAVPSTPEVLSKSGIESARAKTLLQLLLKAGKLVRIGEDLLFHRAAIDKLRELLANRKGQTFGVAEFKDWTGVSRKYAIPLLEFLDRERITRREGDVRLVL
jgi:selenocysteine-specific elongation factor